MIDQTLGKYRILEEIGSGGFATVYRTVDTTLDREVALKVLDPLLMRDEAFVERFQREARAAASLEHPNIVPIYEVDEGDGRLFIAMRLVRGPSLAERLETEGRIPWEDALEILRPVCDALAYAHDAGVVHRDIKPHNILLDARSGAMLTDFGFARLVGTSSLTQSLSGGIVGTPAYIAPEIWEGVDATPATDVYALACVAYEIAAGSALFGGKTPMAVMRAHDRGVQLPEEWPIDVPQDIGRVMGQALARQSDERYADVPQFLEALEALQTAAVAERIAAEVDRLLGEMQHALKANRFERAIVAGERLLEIKSDHAEGARLLGQAQAKLAKTRELAEKLEQERVSLHHDQQILSEKSAALVDKQAQVKAERERLIAQGNEIEAQLKETERQQRLCDESESKLKGQADKLDMERHRQDRRAKRVLKAEALLENGHFEQLEAMLTQPVGPPTAVTRTKVQRPAQPTEKEGPLTNRVSCPECHADNPPSERYCAHCGSRLSGGSAPLVARGETSGEPWTHIARTQSTNKTSKHVQVWLGLAGSSLLATTVAFASGAGGSGALFLLATLVFGTVAAAKHQEGLNRQ